MFRSLGVSRVLGTFSFALFLSFAPISSHAQQISTTPEQAPASSGASSSSSSSNTNAKSDPADLEVSWRKMPARFLHDEKDMWLFPTKLGQGKHWIPTAIV